MGWTAPITWSDGSILYAAQLNQQVRDNLGYLKGETDAFDAHAAAGAAVHGLGAGIYVLGYRGASGKYMVAGGTIVNTAVNTGMNCDTWGEATPSYGAAYSSTPCVFTDVGSTIDIAGLTMAHTISTSNFVLRGYRNSVDSFTVNWFSIG